MVNTVYIPGIVDDPEVENIAKFLSEIDTKRGIDLLQLETQLSHNTFTPLSNRI